MNIMSQSFRKLVPMEPATANAPEKARSKKLTTLVLAVVGAMVFTLAVAGGVWWFFNKQTSSTAFATEPTLAAAVSVSTFGPEVQLAPIGSGATSLHEIDGTTLIGLQSGPTFGVAAVASGGEGGVAQWIVPVGSLSDCSLEGDILSCGSDWTYQVSGGNATLVEDGGESGGAGEATVDKHEEKESGKPSTGNRYDIDGGRIIDSDGAPIFDFGSEDRQIYVLEPSGKGGVWLFSDGQTVVGLKGREVLWQVDLADGSAGVNGFGSDSGPSWTTSGHVLLIGEPGGVLALDINTGEAAWRIPTAVESWMATDTALVVSDGTDLTTYVFEGACRWGATHCGSVLM